MKIFKWFVYLQSHLFSICSFQRFYGLLSDTCCETGSRITMWQQLHGTRNLKFFRTVQWTVPAAGTILLVNYYFECRNLFKMRIAELESSSQVHSFPFSFLFLIFGFFNMCAKHVLAQVIYLSLDFLKFHAVYSKGSDYFPVLEEGCCCLGLIFQLCPWKGKGNSLGVAISA